MRTKKNIRQFLLLSLVFLLTAFVPLTAYAADHLVTHSENMPCVLWTRGCTPTSASMVLGFWDRGDAGWEWFGYGRLIDHWQEYSEYTDGRTGVIRSSPNVLDELRVDMGTDGEGGTSIANIGPGILNVTNVRNLYSFGSSQTYCQNWIWPFGNDWCWGTITNEINNGRPFVWSAGYNNAIGHSLAAWGYTDDKYVITYNTWGCPGRDDWYYNKYNNGSTYDWGYVDTVVPGGGTWGQTSLTTPNGGEVWYAGNTYDIWWHEFDDRTWSADLQYSTDGGVNWTTFATVEPSSPGWKSYSWTIPSTIPSSSRARIRIKNWSGSSSAGWVYQAGDGSEANFTIAKAPDLTITGVTTDVANPSPGQNINVTVNIKNQGAANAGGFYIDIYKNLASAPVVGQYGDEWCYISSLAAGATTTCARNIFYNAVGSYNMWAQVDSAGDIGELNEGNNVSGPNVINVTNKPDLLVTSIATNPTSPNPGQNVTVTINIKNQGLADAGGFDVDLYKNRATAPLPGDYGEAWCSKTGLAAGASDTCVVTVSYAAAGNYNMWAKVDTFDNVLESDENNNISGPKVINVVQTYALNVTKIGTGTGTVTSNPAGINCGATCSADYNSGTVVTLSAAPDVGSVFAGWSGNADCSDGTVTMTVAMTCTATFNLSLPNVSLVVTPDSTSVPRGGTLGYTVKVTNNTTSVQTFKYWTYVTLPNSKRYPTTGELFGPVSVTLNPGQIKSAHLTQAIPGVAPLGTYTYHAHVGPYPAIWDHASFQFNVITATLNPAGPADNGWRILENGLAE